jgi:hypothetical protein
MRGKKGELHPDPADPPRCRANKQRGHGTYANDRPPIVGTVGRESGQVRLNFSPNEIVNWVSPVADIMIAKCGYHSLMLVLTAKIIKPFIAYIQFAH